LVWPILFPCSCNIWVHLLGASKQACCWGIDDILILSMSNENYMGNLALMLETCKNQLCVIAKYVFRMLEVTFFDSRGIVVRYCHEFKKNFLCFLGNHLESVMHVQSILEIAGCYLHFLEYYVSMPSHWLIF
jgi:hypothetical protein